MTDAEHIQEMMSILAETFDSTWFIQHIPKASGHSLYLTDKFGNVFGVTWGPMSDAVQAAEEFIEALLRAGVK